MKNITVWVTVYNEEKRIERFLKSFNAFDEIIVGDKSSTDNTVAICQKYGAKVIVGPYTDAIPVGEGKELLKAGRNDWSLVVTASDVIHPDLPKILMDLINNENFTADVVYVPYIGYVHGISSVHSVYYAPYRPCLFKRDAVTLQDKIHEDFIYNTKNFYYLPKSMKIAIHHLTHQNMDSTFERYMRYSKEETKKNKSLNYWFRFIIRAFATAIKRRSWRIGWDGVAMLLMLILYRIMIFLRAWEKKRGVDVESYYDEFARNLLKNK